jgi:glycosyltransferase involved in cell wall biosynthesis
VHVALIVDSERLLSESAMLRELSLGLGDQGIQITAILPQAAPRDPQPEPPVASAVIETRLGVPPWLRRLRAARIAQALTGAMPDLIYAVGADTWRLAFDLGRTIERPLVLDVWSAAMMRRVQVALPGAPLRVAYVVPTEPLAAALRGRGAAEAVTVVPMGVQTPAVPREVLADSADSITLAIIGSGQDGGGMKAALGGLSGVLGDFPQIQACLELRGPGEHEIWRHARRLDVLGHISTIGHASLHRAIITGCDVLVVPERAGEARSVVLEAMAAGMPLLAADDAFLDMLVADETALVVIQDEWAEKLTRLLTEPGLAQRLGRAARSWVSRHNTPGLQVDRLIGALEGVMAGGTRLPSGT